MSDSNDKEDRDIALGQNHQDSAASVARIRDRREKCEGEIAERTPSSVSRLSVIADDVASNDPRDVENTSVEATGIVFTDDIEISLEYGNPLPDAQHNSLDNQKAGTEAPMPTKMKRHRGVEGGEKYEKGNLKEGGIVEQDDASQVSDIQAHSSSASLCDSDVDSDALNTLYPPELGGEVDTDEMQSYIDQQELAQKVRVPPLPPGGRAALRLSPSR